MLTVWTSPYYDHYGEVLIRHSGSKATFRNSSPKRPLSLRALSLAAVQYVLLFVITFVVIGLLPDRLF